MGFEELNKLFIEWSKTDKSQRFGQYIESNSNLNIGQELYNCDDANHVYGELVDISKGE